MATLHALLLKTNVLSLATILSVSTQRFNLASSYVIIMTSLTLQLTEVNLCPAGIATVDRIVRKETLVVRITLIIVLRLEMYTTLLMLPRH